ncbi:hypothetical protein JL720_9287 [Aureococcus anophagefferens]|nr:hypothetical protein JL720_9287 [Aureococcus anophagefferens]
MGPANPDKCAGTVLWFSKSHGFIKPDDGGEDIFVHGSDIFQKYANDGDRVLYDVGTLKGRPKAVAVEIVDGGAKARKPKADKPGKADKPARRAKPAAAAAAPAGGPRYRGVCKWFNSKNMHGFITPSESHALDPGETDVFCYAEDLAPGTTHADMTTGDPVEYGLGTTKSGRVKAAGAAARRQARARPGRLRRAPGARGPRSAPPRAAARAARRPGGDAARRRAESDQLARALAESAAEYEAQQRANASEREFEAAFDDGAPPDPAPDALDAFLRAVGMGQYAPNLRAEEIETVEDLALLSADDLVEAGFPRDDAAILARVVAGR